MVRFTELGKSLLVGLKPIAESIAALSTELNALATIALLIVTFYAYIVVYPSAKETIDKGRAEAELSISQAKAKAEQDVVQAKADSERRIETAKSEAADIRVHANRDLALSQEILNTARTVEDNSKRIGLVEAELLNAKNRSLLRNNVVLEEQMRRYQNDIALAEKERKLLDDEVASQYMLSIVQEYGQIFAEFKRKYDRILLINGLIIPNNTGISVEALFEQPSYLLNPFDKVRVYTLNDDAFRGPLREEYVTFSHETEGRVAQVEDVGQHEIENPPLLDEIAETALVCGVWEVPSSAAARRNAPTRNLQFEPPCWIGVVSPGSDPMMMFVRRLAAMVETEIIKHKIPNYGGLFLEEMRRPELELLNRITLAKNAQISPMRGKINYTVDQFVKSHHPVPAHEPYGFPIGMQEQHPTRDMSEQIARTEEDFARRRTERDGTKEKDEGGYIQVQNLWFQDKTNPLPSAEINRVLTVADNIIDKLHTIEEEKSTTTISVVGQCNWSELPLDAGRLKGLTTATINYDSDLRLRFLEIPPDLGRWFVDWRKNNNACLQHIQLAIGLLEAELSGQIEAYRQRH